MCENLPRTSTTKEVAVAHDNAQFHTSFSPRIFYQKQYDYRPSSNLLFYVSSIENKAEVPPF
jgi:hypothetical protein